MDNQKFLINVTKETAAIAQQWFQVLSHLDVVNRYDVELFIELGVYMGGTLIHLLPNLIINENFRYLGFEINKPVVHPKILEFSQTNPRCRIVLGDMFAPENMKLIIDGITNTPGRVYIFCDGGNKPKELLTFSPHLKIGDIISVHDYFDGKNGEIMDKDLAKLPKDVVPLGDWRRTELGLPTFIKVEEDENRDEGIVYNAGEG